MKNRLDIYLDKEEIRDVIYSYCRATDRRDFDLLSAIIHPEARMEYGIFSGTGAEFIEFSKAGLAAIGMTQHSITNILITVDEDVAHAESYCTALHGDLDVDGSHIDLMAYIRYIDAYRKIDGKWLIVQRTVAFDWNQNLTTTVNWDSGLLGAYFPRGRNDTDDCSYSLAPGLGSR